jgi:contactin associated protein-like 2
VDGFEGKGSYYQAIQYHAPIEMVETLVNRSSTCVQKLGYNCKRSRLLNTPVSESQDFSPFGWWVSRQNKKMDYWPGSLPGSRKCECGLFGDCFDVGYWCNWDSGHHDWWDDGGEIKEKEYLPVKALHFGDTGNPVDRKEGRYNLGPLECQGDMLFESMITFRKQDGVIQLPTFEMGITSGDIFFEFKTALERPMVLLHSVGDNGDFIKVSLISGDSIQFEFSAGKGIQGVTVETSYRLDDNRWHSVLIEKNRKEAMVVIDGAQKTQVPEPAGPVRPFKLTSPLYIGATKEWSDGYVGCLRALVLNGVPVDLVNEVTKHPWGLYGVQVGCQGRCEKNPCKNNGECLEGYDHFKCNCRWTPFKGPICADEIGVNMRTNYMIKYDFKGKYKSTIAERIHVGFTSTDPKGFLVGLESSVSKEYLTLMLSNSGHIRLVFDFGFERQEIVFTEQNFMTGQYHDVLVERYDNGKKLRMTIDNYPPLEKDFSNSLKASADAQFDNIQYLYIGKNESMREGFVGCISRVEFDEIIPLKLYFQEDPHDNINSVPEIITEDFCGIEPVTLKPEEEETRRPPEVNQKSIEHFYSNTSSVILGIILSLIASLIVIVCFATGKYINRHKGDYYTQEDEGAYDAFDADTAVLQGRTGHQVQKKKEWFI